MSHKSMHLMWHYTLLIHVCAKLKIKISVHVFCNKFFQFHFTHVYIVLTNLYHESENKQMDTGGFDLHKVKKSGQYFNVLTYFSLQS